MPTILISSPEPETQELATLAFELDGWTVFTAGEHRQEAAEIALLDIPNREQVEEVTESAPAADYEGRAVVLLPRGMDPESARRSMGEAYHFIRRPFEITSIVRFARELATALAPAARSRAVPRPAARARKSGRPKARTAKRAPARRTTKAKASTKKRPRKFS